MEEKKEIQEEEDLGYKVSKTKEPSTGPESPRSVSEKKIKPELPLFMKFYTTYFISLAVLFFAFFKLTVSTGENETPLWVGMITGIASQYMPSPLFNKYN